MGVDLGPPTMEVIEEPEMLHVGDTVEYLPHICHAFTADGNNQYPWVIGLRQNPHYETNPQTGEKEIVEDIVELDEGHLHRSVIPRLMNAPNPRDQKSLLVPLRPKNPWRAVVQQIHEDKSADLAIESNIGRGMVTLHYAKVPLDATGRTPHSYRTGKGHD